VAAVRELAERQVSFRESEVFQCGLTQLEQERLDERGMHRDRRGFVHVVSLGGYRGLLGRTEQAGQGLLGWCSLIGTKKEQAVFASYSVQVQAAGMMRMPAAE
jgi:hypothetical protein